MAGQRGIAAVGDRVRVVVEAIGADGSPARDAVSSAGGLVEAEYANLVKALVPTSALETVANHPGVAYVRPPFRPEPEAVLGEGVGATNASAWQASGLTGAGVKVAVIDVGFAGYADRIASGDLPASAVAANCTVNPCASGSLTTSDGHGTAVAEIVHEIAPGAQLYLIAIDDDVDLGRAKDYAKSQGVQIVNHSIGWFNTSRGDGNGAPSSPDGVVADARANGILWVNAAGNHAQNHWSGAFYDPDDNGWHNFSGTDESNYVYVASGAAVRAYLRWDSWPTTSQNYDLFLWRLSDGQVVRDSRNLQTGSQRPTEELYYTNTGASGWFGVAIGRYNATVAPMFDLFVVSTEGSGLYYSSADGSIVEPASSPNAMAVGAVQWWDRGLEPFSSRGPTIGGRIKPDIAGQDGVSSATAGPYPSGGFYGTSAASPHVAGAAALVKQAYPAFRPDQIQSFLEGRAVDLGPAGKDNSYGSGALWLGDAPPWRTYSTSNSGLVNDRVWAIAVDGTGSVWIGTEGGVSRFDASGWTTYNTD